MSHPILIFITTNNHIKAFDIQAKELLWAHILPFPITSMQLCCSDNKILLRGEGNTTITALRISDGIMTIPLLSVDPDAHVFFDSQDICIYNENCAVHLIKANKQLSFEEWTAMRWLLRAYQIQSLNKLSEWAEVNIPPLLRRLGIKKKEFMAYIKRPNPDVGIYNDHAGCIVQ